MKSLTAYAPLFLGLLLFTSCPDAYQKPDRVIDSSPGPVPAWVTGQKKQDTPTREYYVGYGKAGSKARARENAIRDVAIQISRRIMLEVYSLDSRDESTGQLIRKTATTVTKSILYDLKITREYFQQKLAQSGKSKTYHEFYIYTSYPTTSLISTRQQIIKFLHNKAIRALKAYEAAMIQMKRGLISSTIHNLLHGKSLLKDLGFHSFSLNSKNYPDITNSQLLSGAIQRAIHDIKGNISLTKEKDGQSVTAGSQLPEPLVLRAIYQSGEDEIPVQGLKVTFSDDSGLRERRETDKSGRAKLHLRAKVNHSGRVKLLATVKLSAMGQSIPLSRDSLHFSYTIIPAVDMAVVLLEELEDQDGGVSGLPATRLSGDIVKVLKNFGKKSRAYHVTSSREKELFTKAKAGDHKAIRYFKRRGGARSVMICELKTRFSSRAFGKFIFYRTTIHIKMLDGDSGKIILSERVDRVKGGGISADKAIHASVGEAIPKIVTSITMGLYSLPRP
ncbi:MAG: LPP20 family lipoprotein [Spirochaetota bacterium]|nr:LPP20 family lipoprotein [Spirochaetota bacterium]